MTSKLSSLLPARAAQFARFDIVALMVPLRRAVPHTQSPAQAVRALNWAIADQLGQRRLS